MANHGTIQRPSITPPSPSMLNRDEDSTGKQHDDFNRPEFKIICPFYIPSSPEAAAIRMVKNLSHFALYYAHFVWIILLITLIPARKVSLVFLVIMTYVASLFLLIVRAIPSSSLFHRIVNKRLVLGLIVVATMIELIVTNAGLHLLLTMAGSIPVVLIHAVLWVREDFSVVHGENASRELLHFLELSAMV